MTQTLLDNLNKLLESAIDAANYSHVTEHLVVSAEDIRAIIEQAKAEKQEPVARASELSVRAPKKLAHVTSTLRVLSLRAGKMK